ncbi:MAG: hypothetical protein KatS3mg011_1358 [Acidimicrobiia bacterium]|jgi:quinol monooxygenase YgiN|nr:MAG: hypothetical protein KatS3mg011_1358 [Acidimicrobiia bacterium]
MVIRLFLSAVAPGDVDEVIELFRSDVVPAFRAHPDCLGIELVMAEQPGVSGLVEGGAITRWKSIEAMEKALTSPELVASQARVRKLLRREPIRKVYRVLVS